MFGIDYTVTPNCVHITDSYKVRKWNMRKLLLDIRAKHEQETTVFQRSIFSLKMEWIAHNFLYEIGYKRSQTKDVDLDNPCDKPEWLYIVCGLLTWIFVW